MSRSAACPAASASPEAPRCAPRCPTCDAQPYSVRALRSSAHAMCSGALSALGAPAQRLSIYADTDGSCECVAALARRHHARRHQVSSVHIFCYHTKLDSCRWS